MPSPAAPAPIHIAPVHPPTPPPLHLLPLHAQALMTPKPGTVDVGGGVKSPTPSEVAEQMVQQAKALLAQVIAKQNAWVKAHPRPAANAQPSVIADWFKGAGGSLVHWFPEWNWKTVQKGPPALSGLASSLVPQLASMFEPGESIATVSLGSNDGVTYYVHPNGAWSYHHVWGEDWTQAIADAANAIGHAVSEAENVVGSVLKDVQTLASFIPGVGQIVNEVVAAAETALDALSGANALQIALDAAYHAALAAVPGAEALATFLDPVVSTLRTLAGGKKAIGKAVLAAALKEVPDSPSIGDLSPRSVASSLASWLASKLGIA